MTDTATQTVAPRAETAATLARREGPLGWIVFDNPLKANAITMDMWEEMSAALRDFAADPEVRCVIVRGKGERAFCSGADVGEKDRVAKSGAAPGPRRDLAVIAELAEFAKPTIAMIHGYCLGGGMAIACACDFRIAGSSARFGIPAARLGLGLPFVVIERLVRLVGPANAKRIVFTADRFDAPATLDLGFLDEVHVDESLEAQVRALADRIAANAPLTVAAAKFAIGQAGNAGADRDLAGCTAHEEACTHSADYIEGRAAFLEKRQPNFTGS